MPLIVLGILSAIATFAVIRDSNARGMNGPLWGLSVMVTTMLALPVYLLARRPKRI